jgi:hypothetical protein
MTVQQQESAPESAEQVEQGTEQQQDQPQQQPKPTETVDFWKAKAREQESRAKANKLAADELAVIKDAQKTEAEKVADRIRKADEEVASVPVKVTEALKAHLIGLHQINDEDAELFLTATNPDLLLKQVARLTARDAVPPKKPNHVPREGANPTAPENDGREAVRRIFGEH